MSLYHDTPLHQDTDRRRIQQSPAERALLIHDLIGVGLLFVFACLLAYFAKR